MPTIFYAFCFVLILFWTVKRHTNIITKYIVSIWVGSASLAIIFQSMVPFLYERITYSPYVFMIVCFCISIIPIIKNSKRMTTFKDNINSRLLVYVMWGFIIVSIVPFYENLREVLTTTSSNNGAAIADMYDSKMYGGGFKITWLSSVGLLCNSIIGVFFTFVFFVPFYLLTKPGLKKSFTILMFIPVSTHLLFQVACSGRGTVVMFIMVALFLLLLFKDRIPENRIRLVKIGGLSIIGLLVVAMVIITFARKDATNAGDEDAVFIGYYVCKSHLDFNNNLWYIPVYTEGDNTIAFFKNLIGLDTFTSFLKKEQYWGAKIGVPPGYFYTYIGDTYMDFGPIFTIVFFIILTLGTQRYFSNNNNSPVKLFLFYIYCEMIIMGWTINYFKTYDGMRNMLISVIFFSLIVKKSQKKKIYYEQQESKGDSILSPTISSNTSK